MNLLKPILIITFLLSYLTLTGCITKQTTTSNGAFVEEKYVIKRPVKNLIQNLEVE
jgi:hypothetical protein